MQFLIKLVCLVLIVLAVLLMLLIAFPLVKDDGNEISRTGSVIAAARSFVNYQGHIYALVPSNGYYRLDGVDPARFSPLDPVAQSNHLGRDDRHVYCGNQIVPQLDPAATHLLGEGYLSDGQFTYYCAPFTVRNRDLSMPVEIWQLILHKLGQGPKPQTYYHPLFALTELQKPIEVGPDSRFIRNRSQIYYRGQLLAAADPSRLRPLAAVRDGQVGRSEHYFSDGQRLYFKADRLETPDNGSMRELRIGSLDDEPYLFDQRSRMVQVRNVRFDPRHAPYDLLSSHGTHVYQALFAGNDGIYFFDKQELVAKRAGRNPMADGKFAEIAPAIFYDGHDTYFLRAQEFRERQGNGGGSRLSRRTTQINHLLEAEVGTWENINPRGAGDSAVWRKGDAYFYMDQFGVSQDIANPIYRISDQALALSLAQQGNGNSVYPGQIRQLIKDGKLVVPEHETIVEATTRYREDYSFLVWLIGSASLLILGLITALPRLYSYFRRASLAIEQDNLLVLTALKRRYPIHTIGQVQFSIAEAKPELYVGKVQIEGRDGRKSPIYELRPDYRAQADRSRLQVITQIKLLRQWMTVHGIQSAMPEIIPQQPPRLRHKK